MIAYIHRGLLAVPAKTIARELALSEDQMGWVLSGFFWTYAIGQVPCGWLGDRFGTRRILPVYAVIWSAAAGAMGLATSFAELLTCQLWNGFAQAGIFPCAVRSIAHWFPKSQRALANGMLGSFMSVGGVLASVAIGFLLEFRNWHTVFLGLSSLGFVWAAAFFHWFRDRPEEHAAVNGEELRIIREEAKQPEAVGSDAVPVRSAVRDESVPLSTPWLALFASVPMLLICGQQFFRAAGYIFYATWFPTYLQQTRGVSQEDSGYMAGLALAGVVAGSLTGGIVSDRIFARTGSLAASRKGLALAGLACCSLLVLAAYFIDDPLLASAVIACGSFCAGTANPVAYSLTIDLGCRNVSTVFSLMNMSGNIGAALSPKLVNWLVDASGKNWNSVLLLFAAIYLAATVCWSLIDTGRTLGDGNGKGDTGPGR
jgi:ACS family glucarate transporter-like MFS transporter/ACS family D-galactonate transporter-like MFS transporter